MTALERWHAARDDTHARFPPPRLRGTARLVADAWENEDDGRQCTIATTVRACCTRWGWDPAGTRVGVLDFLLYDGWLEPGPQLSHRTDVRRYVEAAVADRPEDDGGDDEGSPADIAGALRRAWDRWPRRGPPDVPVRRPLNGRDLAQDANGRAALRRPEHSRGRTAMGGDRVFVPHY